MPMKQYFEKIYKGSKAQFLDMLKMKSDAGIGSFVITANPEIFMMGCKSKKVNEVLLDNNVLIVPDGIGILHGGNKLGYQFEERIPGVEICEALLQYADENGKSVYLFGAEKKILNTLVDKIQIMYPSITISGYKNGYVEDKDAVFREIIDKNPDIVLVALGVPQQELLIHRYFQIEGKGIYIGVGGSFDVLSGMKKRAPEFFIKHNLEWLYRITSEPKRIKRFWNSNIKFLFKIRKEQNENRRQPKKSQTNRYKK